MPRGIIFILKPVKRHYFGGLIITFEPMRKMNINVLNPAAFPFFYGYVVMILGTVGVWASIPGQTVGVSTFTDPVKNVLGLSRDQFSIAYMLGTLGSSFLISSAGRWFDRFGARAVATAAALMLAISLFLASYTNIAAELIQSVIGLRSWLIPFILITIVFFLFRFSGQGVLTMSSRNMVMKWFERYRGRVNAVNALSVTIGFSMAPVLIDSLITRFGWDGAWRVMSLAMLMMAGIAFLFYRDNPEKYGLIPDGTPAKPTSKAIEKKEFKSIEPREAFKSRVFWVYSLMLAYNSFFITGFTFHVVSIFQSVGFEKTVALSVFIPISIISVSFSLIFNFLSDYIRLKYILYFMITGGFLAAIGMSALGYRWGLYLVIGGLGTTGGLFGVLNAIAWPRLFGRKYLGTISGKAMSMVVFASALAPVLFSLSLTLFKSYSAVAWLALLFMVFMAINAYGIRNPRLPSQD